MIDRYCLIYKELLHRIMNVQYWRTGTTNTPPIQFNE